MIGYHLHLSLFKLAHVAHLYVDYYLNQKLADLNYSSLFHTTAWHHLAIVLGLSLVECVATVELSTRCNLLIYNLCLDRKIYRRAQKAKIALVDQLNGLAISVKLT